MGKKKGEKKDGGGGGKKDAKVEGLMRFRESLLEFQLESKSHSSKELEKEAFSLRDQNERLKERNIKLKKEQFTAFQALLRQSRNQEKEIENNQIYNSGHVEAALKTKWDTAEHEEKVIEAMMVKIQKIDKVCAEAEQQVHHWTDWRDGGGKRDNELRIKLLHDELKDMKEKYEEMCNLIKNQLKQAFSSIESKAEKQIAEQRLVAADKAIKQLDQKSLQEVRENKWLKKEAETHRVEEANLQSQIEVLEQKNLKIISELLNCRQEDLKISTNFCVDNLLENTEVLKGDRVMNLENLSIYQSEGEIAIREDKKCKCSDMPSRIRDEVEPPPPHHGEHSSKLDTFDDIESKVIAKQEQDINLHEDQDFLHLGPMEVRLLHVAGKSKPLHKNLKSGSHENFKQVKLGGKKLPGFEPESRSEWPVNTATYRAIMEKNLDEDSS